MVPGTVGIHLKPQGNKLTLAFSQDRGKPATVKIEAFNMSDGALRVLMGAGELLRANAMTGAEASERDTRQFELFVKTT